MARRLYSLLLYVLMPIIWLRLFWRARRAPAYRERWRERWGIKPAALQAPLRPLWIHAVSVGETLAAKYLIDALLESHPQVPILVTTMTPTGSAQVQRLWGDRVWHVYAPYDWPSAVQRFLSAWQPRALVVMETELWPNLLALTRARGVPILLANARLSERSAKGYVRAGALATELMQQLTKVAAQDRETAERFMALGVPAERVVTTGSVKFDMAVPDAVREEAARWRVAWQLYQRHIWVAASTHEGEDVTVLAAHQALLQQQPNALLILVPRHPERFDTVAGLVSHRGLKLARRSQHEPVLAETEVLLGDTMGELLLWLALSQVAFIGGSLQPIGGHNALEALALGVPALTGPHYHNFQVINDALLQAGALSVVRGADDLAKQVAGLWHSPELQLQRQEAGYAVLQANQGATAKQLALLTPWLD